MCLVPPNPYCWYAEYAEDTLLADFMIHKPCTREAAWVKILEQDHALLSDLRGAVDSKATIPEFSRM